MSQRTTRREFLKKSAAAGAGFWILKQYNWAQGQAPNDKLNIAIIGAGGRGGNNLDGVRGLGHNIVALCDVDTNMMADAVKKCPDAAIYSDFRKMLNEKRKMIDAVVISTPDHTHAVAAIMAMKMGKHVYCEKPLTHSVYEARQMADVARRMKVATQMGNQAHSSESLRRAVDLVKSGALGPIAEVHCWSDRPIWPQGIERPTDMPAVPSHINWEAWLGPAPARPYHPAYHPFSWRGWWDFGTGALGDMGCHIIDTAYWALGLTQPTAVSAEGDPIMTESGPKWEIVQYEFPARLGMPPVKLTWYDGGRKPSADLVNGMNLETNGSIFVGARGVCYYPHGGNTFLIPAEKFGNYQAPRTLPTSPGHYEEWIRACKGGDPALGNFEYSAALTEAVLLGSVALRLKTRIEWDTQRMRITNVRNADHLIKRPYRRGWSL